VLVNDTFISQNTVLDDGLYEAETSSLNEMQCGVIMTVLCKML
jgi:hypothetical protein